MTFSDGRVIERVNRDFVAVWKNIRPEAKFPDGTYDGWAANWVLQLGNATAPQNVASLFCTPEGEVLHALAGYWKPDEYVEEIEFARGLFAGDPPSAHLRRAQKLPEADARRAVHVRLAAGPAPRLEALLKNAEAGLR